MISRCFAHALSNHALANFLVNESHILQWCHYTEFTHICAYAQLISKAQDLLRNLKLQWRISGCAKSKVNSYCLWFYTNFWLGSPDLDGRRNSADQDSVRSCAYCCRPTSRVWSRPTSVQNLEKASRSHYTHMPDTTSLVLNTEFN